MKSLQDLERVRNEARERLAIREGKLETRVVVGMGTCGIAAGARDVVAAFMDELAKRRLTGISVSQTGCAGLCEYEPMVDIYLPNSPKVTYVYVTPEKARQIVAQHICNGEALTQWMLAR